MDNIFIEVSVKERFPKISGYYITNNGNRLFSDHINVWQRNENDKPLEWWLEVVTLDHIEDKRELTATFLVNSIRLLDEQGARHLVKELCERFHLLPSKESVCEKSQYAYNARVFKEGANYILENLKGVSNG